VFFFEVDRIAIVELGSMFSQPWTTKIREHLEESVGGLFVNLNGSVVIEEIFLVDDG